MIMFYICIYILYVSTRTDLYLKYDRVWTRAGWRLTRARLRAVRGHLPVACECSIHRLINLVDDKKKRESYHSRFGPTSDKNTAKYWSHKILW